MDIDDEDVVLQNSPLDQYLEQFNETYVKYPRSLDGIDTKTKNQTNNSMKYFGYNQLIFKHQIILYMNFIREKGVFEESDTDAVFNYLMVAYSAVNNFKRKENLLGFLIFSSTLYGIHCKNVYIGISLFFTSFLVWFILKISIGFMYSLIFKMVINKCLKISAESRSLVLMLQELLSINRGYHKIVPFSDESDNIKLTSSSNNSAPILAFSNRLFFMLSSCQCQHDNYRKMLTKNYIETYSYSEELSWLLLNDVEDAELCSNDIKLNQENPLFQLKTLHNVCHEQTLAFIKISILLLINCDNYMQNISVLFHLLMILFRDSLFLKNLQKTRLLLSIKCDDVKKKPEKPVKSQMESLTQSFHLHIFELHSLTKLFDKIDEKNPEELISKCKRHIEGLTTILGDINSLVCKDLDCSIENRNNESSKPIKLSDDNSKICEKTKEIDDYEVLDEVLEAVIGSEKYEDKRQQSIDGHIDTFEEKYKLNANCLMKELQSVIDVKAAEWKERETIAKKRREAEGKFVLKDELENDESQTEELQSDVQMNLKVSRNQITEYGDTENDKNSLDDETVNENRDRFLLATNVFGGLSFQEMILKQRNLIQDNDDVNENVFEDNT